MQARAICMIEALIQLKWLNQNNLENKFLSIQNDRRILTHQGKVIGFAEPKFKL